MTITWIIVGVFVCPNSIPVCRLGVHLRVGLPPLISNIGLLGLLKKHLKGLFVRLTAGIAFISIAEISVVDFAPCITSLTFFLGV